MNVSACSYNVTQAMPLFALIFNGPLMTFCAIFGCIGNSISIINLARKMHMGKVLRDYLICLAMWDSAVLICIFCYYGLYNLMILGSGSNFEQTGFWAYLVVIFHGPLSVALTGSAWTTVAIAFSRYFVVLCPLRTVTVRAFSQSVYLNISLSVCVILYCIPCFFELTLATCFEQNTKAIVVYVWPWLLHNKIYRILYRTISYTLFVSIGPFIATLIMSIHTVYLLKKRNKRFTSQNKTIRQTKKSHWRIGILFFILLGKFLLCYSIPTIVMLWFNFVGPKSFGYEVMKVVAVIGNFLVVLNSATNFLVYMIWQKFYTTKRVRKSQSLTKMEMNSVVSSASNLQLTLSQSEILYKSWQEAKQCRGRKLFHRLVVFLLEEQDNVDEMLDVQSMASQTDNMMGFFDKIVSEIHTDPMHKLPSRYVQQVGRTHQQYNIKLTNDILRNFKVFLLEEVKKRKSSQPIVGLGPSNVAYENIESEETCIWFRLLSAIIAELKLGYMATPSAEASSRQILIENEDNPCSPLLMKSKQIQKYTM